MDELPQPLPGPDDKLNRLTDDKIVGFRGFPFWGNDRDSVVSGARLGQVMRENIKTRGFERVPINIDLETEFLLDVLTDQESESFTRDNGDLDEAGFSPQEGGHSVSAVRNETADVSEAEPFTLGFRRDVFAQADRLESLHEFVVPHVAADRFVASAVGGTSIRIIDSGNLTRFDFEDAIGDQSVVSVAVARHRVRPTC